METTVFQMLKNKKKNAYTLYRRFINVTFLLVYEKNTISNILIAIKYLYYNGD